MADLGEASSSEPGGIGNHQQAEAEPWRKLSAVELRANTVVFRARKQVKLNQYVCALEEAGIDAAEILSIQVSTTGDCRVTLSKASIAEKVNCNGFRLGEENIFPVYYLSKSHENFLQLHIHDAPVWLSDCLITGALAQYGTVEGNVRHGKFKVRDGLFVASGVRFATFKPKPGVKSIPSYVRSVDGKTVFRVYHDGQQPTCRKCGSPNHLAANCTATSDSSNPQAQQARTSTPMPRAATDPKATQAASASFAAVLQGNGHTHATNSSAAPPDLGRVVSRAPSDLSDDLLSSSSSDDTSASDEEEDEGDDSQSYESSYESLDLGKTAGDQAKVTVDVHDAGEVTPTAPTDQHQSTQTNALKPNLPTDNAAGREISPKHQPPVNEGLLWETPGKRKASQPVPSPDSETRKQVKKKKKKRKARRRD